MAESTAFMDRAFSIYAAPFLADAFFRVRPPKNSEMTLLSYVCMNILFVCSRNQWRSPTAEKVWSKHPGISVRSAGTSPRARKTVSAKDIQWADIIFAMEQKHKDRLKAEFPQLMNYQTTHVLDIPDEYRFMDAELVELLQNSVESYLSRS